MKFAGQELPTGFVGRSPKIVQIRDQIEKLRLSRVPVLIHGETGTGKEVAARSLYNACPRGAFVPIDCGSLVGSLMESELFGHTRGSFTGASETKKGLMDLANGGTAFLDEIGDLPLELQVKLLRVIQEKEFRPVGSLQWTKVDVRIIAATHRDLQKEVAAGRFREDLYHRLNVLRITLPPLRERKEDIPLLIERFLAAADRRYVMTKEAMDFLVAYEWPGNIRELKNCLERMMDLSSEPLLTCDNLPSTVLAFVRAQQAGTMAAVVAGSVSVAAPAHPTAPFVPSSPTAEVIPLHEIERSAIMHALGAVKGDRTVAAHLLRIGRTTLYRKLKNYQTQ